MVTAPPARNGSFRTSSDPIRMDIDKTDVQAGEALPAHHTDGYRNGPPPVGQMAAVPPGEGTGDLDIPDGIIVVVAQGKGDLRVRPKAGPPPGLSRYSVVSQFEFDYSL
jgi:hypothetical protein